MLHAPVTTTLLIVLAPFKVSSYSYSSIPILSGPHPEKGERNVRICTALPTLNLSQVRMSLQYQIPQSTTSLSYLLKWDVFLFIKTGYKIKLVHPNNPASAIMQNPSIIFLK